MTRGHAAGRLSGWTFTKVLLFLRSVPFVITAHSAAALVPLDFYSKTKDISIGFLLTNNNRSRTVLLIFFIKAMKPDLFSPFWFL